MDFLSLVKQRQSDRAFDPERSVEPEKLERILEAGRLAPSSCNSQPWHFIVVDDPELKNRVADATSNRILNINHFTKQAPVHIVIVEESANISAGLGGWIKRKHFPHILFWLRLPKDWAVVCWGGSTKKPCVRFWEFLPEKELYSIL